LRLLIKWLDTPEQQSLNRAFASWLVEVALPKQHPDAKFPEINNLEGVNSMLAETIQGWYAEAEAKGKKEGEKEGEKKGWIKGKVAGKAEGKIEGNIEGQAKSLILLLETKFSSLSEDQRNSIFELKEAVIEKAMTYIFRTSSIEDMFLYIVSLDELDKS
jgi:hypothetical protein